jgi:hypothetical protein
LFFFWVLPPIGPKSNNDENNQHYEASEESAAFRYEFAKKTATPRRHGLTWATKRWSKTL